MRGKSYLVGLLTGAIVSGLVTLSLTPNSGKETRRKLQNTTESWIHQLSEIRSQLLQIQKDLASATKEGRETITTLMSDLSTILTNWKQEISPHQLQLQKEIASLESTIEKIEASIRK